MAIDLGFERWPCRWDGKVCVCVRVLVCVLRWDTVWDWIWTVLWNDSYMGKSSYLRGWRTWANLDWGWLCMGWPINKASKIVFQKLITQSGIQDHLSACQKCRALGPTLDLLNYNLQFSKIPKWPVSTLTSGKHWFKRQDWKQAR